MITVGTTFSGIGSPEQALKNLGIDHSILWACDIDKYARETYLANHACETWYDDITKIDISQLKPVDLYVFGFPCQDLSVAGAQNLEKGRSALVNYSLDIIDAMLPKYILFENVKGLLNKKFTEFYKSIEHRIKSNYDFHLYRLNSKDFGVAHNRERVFGVGIRKDLKRVASNFVLDNKTAHFQEILESVVDDKYFLSAEKARAILETCYSKQKDFALKSEYGEVKQANKNGLFGDKKIRYSGAIFCQNCIDIHGIIYPDGATIRKFTPRECMRLQGFPDSFVVHPKNRHAYRQAGNTITVTVLEALFRNILELK